jgi:hypothetical protein
VPFSFLIIKKYALALSNLTVTLQMITDTDHSGNDEWQPQISTGDHAPLPINQEGRRYRTVTIA